MATKRGFPGTEKHREAGSAPEPSGDPIGILLALGLAFRSVESAMGGSQPWLSVDLTMAQLKAVMLIVHTGGVPSSTLAEHLGVARSAVTALVDRLVEQKLVRREVDPADRRVICIRPTSRAEVLHQALLQTRRPVLERVWREVPAAERETLHRALELLLDCAEQALQKEQDRNSPPADVNT